jgi:hypothetical protein
VTRATLNERQVNLLASFKWSHDEGLKSRPYFVPFGVSRLQLSGAGMAMTGLIKRGLVVERNDLFYITEDGLAALAKARGES